jgi:hypothetical protein
MQSEQWSQRDASLLGEEVLLKSDGFFRAERAERSGADPGKHNYTCLPLHGHITSLGSILCLLQIPLLLQAPLHPPIVVQ